MIPSLYFDVFQGLFRSQTVPKKHPHPQIFELEMEITGQGLVKICSLI